MTAYAHMRLALEDASQVLLEMQDKVKRRARNYYKDVHRNLNDRQEKRYIEFLKRRWSIDSYRGVYPFVFLDEQSADDE